MRQILVSPVACVKVPRDETQCVPDKNIKPSVSVLDAPEWRSALPRKESATH
jgi:hypothetical protein